MGSELALRNKIARSLESYGISLSSKPVFELIGSCPCKISYRQSYNKIHILCLSFFELYCIIQLKNYRIS